MNISFPGAKQFLFLSFLLLCAASLHARILPINPHEGIWNVTTRLGSTIDNILGATGCQYFIQQADIPLTVTAPGNYCLIETVTFNGTAVTINSSDVSFDMNNYAMDGLFTFSSVGINIVSGNNIVIQSGMIKHATVAGIASTRFLNNVVIKNVSMIGIGALNTGGAIMLTGGVEGLLIEDCYSSNAGPIRIVGSGVTIRNCEIDDFLVGTGAGAIILSGISPSYISRYSIIQDCNLTSSFATDGQGISVQLTQNVIIQNCAITGPINTGIALSGVTNVQCLGCYIQGSGVAGISISDLGSIGVTSLLVDACFISGSVGSGILVNAASQLLRSISFINCFSCKSTAHGALVSTPGGIVQDITFRECIFSDNTLSGLALTGTGFIAVVEIDNCIAQGNGRYGYEIQTTTTLQDFVFTDVIAQNNGIDGFATVDGGLMRNMVFEHCFSQNNAGDGFDFSATTSIVKVRNSLSESNGGVGYRSNAPVGANIFLANSSFGDTGGGFIGVDYALTKTGATDVSAATYWNNVVFS